MATDDGILQALLKRKTALQSTVPAEASAIGPTQQISGIGTNPFAYGFYVGNRGRQEAAADRALASFAGNQAAIRDHEMMLAALAGRGQTDAARWKFATDRFADIAALLGPSAATQFLERAMKDQLGQYETDEATKLFQAIRSQALLAGEQGEAINKLGEHHIASSQEPIAMPLLGNTVVLDPEQYKDSQMSRTVTSILNDLATGLTVTEKLQTPGGRPPDPNDEFNKALAGRERMASTSPGRDTTPGQAAPYERMHGASSLQHQIRDRLMNNAAAAGMAPPRFQFDETSGYMTVTIIGPQGAETSYINKEGQVFNQRGQPINLQRQ